MYIHLDSGKETQNEELRKMERRLKMTNYKTLTSGLIGGWFVFAVLASVLGLFTNTSNGIGVAVALAAGVPLVAFGIWLAVSEGFRNFALSLNPRVLTFAKFRNPSD